MSIYREELPNGAYIVHIYGSPHIYFHMDDEANKKEYHSDKRILHWLDEDGKYFRDYDMPNYIEYHIDGTRVYCWFNEEGKYYRLDDKPTKIVHQCGFHGNESVYDSGDYYLKFYGSYTDEKNGSVYEYVEHWLDTEGKYFRSNGMPTKIQCIIQIDDSEDSEDVKYAYDYDYQQIKHWIVGSGEYYRPDDLPTKVIYYGHDNEDESDDNYRTKIEYWCDQEGKYYRPNDKPTMIMYISSSNNYVCYWFNQNNVLDRNDKHTIEYYNKLHICFSVN